MSRYLTVGLTALAGVALFEAALIPGLALGFAAVLAPKYLRPSRLWPAGDAVGSRPAPLAQRSEPDAAAPAPRGLKVGQAVLKTVTFRIVVTTLDFSTNLVIIGELSTAAGLSAFNLVAGPLYYFAHEATWNYLGPAEAGAVLLPAPNTQERSTWGGFTISRALAKTITFRTFATIADFTANYVVVRDVVTAMALSASGFVLGPFVYFGHEKAWDYFVSAGNPSPRPPPPRRLSAPA
jgi:uncharacterized membrane protein